MERKYISIKDIQKEYLPIGLKNIRNIVKKNAAYTKIGNRILAERASLEAYLAKTQNQEA
jgi:hypothetical protein